MKKFLFYLWQWTWGFTVNVAGGIAYLICTKIKKYDHEMIGYSHIVFVPWNQGGLSLGTFIFMKANHTNEDWTYDTKIHEYGHTWQCLLLGPLYWLVVALPSAIWCNLFENYRQKNNVSYYKLYCEAWANAWGQRATGLKMRRINKQVKK